MANNNKNPDILARLDAYLPALNTGLMDGKIQDVIIKHPLVRSLVVPECDLEARRRCISLISKALAAATPVLPLILQDHQTRQDQSNKKRKGNNNATFDSHKIPKLSLDAQSRLITIVASMAERDSLIRFWMNHHVNSQHEESKKRKYSTASSTSNSSSSSTTSKYLDMSSFDLYLKVKTSKELLADLADRIQGAVCKAFWECWDEIFITLAEIVGADLLQKADQGRIFRPCGDAAIYLNNLKVTKKRQVEQKRRLSMLETQRMNIAQQPISINHIPNIPASPFSPDQFLNDIVGNVGGGSNGSNMNGTTIPTSNSTSNTTSNTTSTGNFLPLSPDKSSGSPDSDSIFSLNTNMTVPTPPSSTTSKLPLVDSNDLEFIMQDVYPDNKFEQYIGAFTTLDDNDFTPNGHNLVPTPTSTPQTVAFTPQASPPNTSSNSSNSHLNLRQRIKLMEEGKMPEEKPSPSNIVW